jgi:hypothetical protein
LAGTTEGTEPDAASDLGPRPGLPSDVGLPDRSRGGAGRLDASGRRVLFGCLFGLLLLYIAVIALGDHRAYSGSDAGGKAASVRVMADRGTSDPDIGYWASRIDPDGLHHGLVNTTHRGDTYVQSTSIPFTIVESWLWDLGGSAAALALPVVGGLLAAYAAHRLARGLGASGHGAVTALLAVGLLGPVAFYTGDLWEHAPAVGVALLATALVVDARGWWSAAVAGLAIGSAVVLRAEVAIHAVALAAMILAVGECRRWWLARWRWLVAGACGAVLPVIGNHVLEQAVMSTDLRSDRAGALVQGAGTSLGLRVSGAFVQATGLFADDGGGGVVMAVVVAFVLLVLAGVGTGRLRMPPPAVRFLVVLGLALYLGRFAQGLGFIPGMLAASPLAAVGVVAGLGRGIAPWRRALVGAALLELVLVFVLQWPGNLVAQWGSRYLLVPGAVLAVVGAVALWEHGTATWFRNGVLGLATVVAAFGLVWHVQRTNQVAKAFDRIDAVSAGTVLASTDANFLREGGSWYRYGDRWLSVDDQDQLLRRGGYADRLDVDRVALLEPLDPSVAPAEPDPDRFQVVSDEVIPLTGGDVRLLVLERR